MSRASAEGAGGGEALEQTYDAELAMSTYQGVPPALASSQASVRSERLESPLRSVRSQDHPYESPEAADEHARSHNSHAQPASLAAPDEAAAPASVAETAPEAVEAASAAAAAPGDESA
eukprot:Rhum_TRINITY_DN14220_c12_g1::Rhum_TRINITY_DN14220_c12_g1_i1::g.74391::m.74391